jgi:hypothetical protein
MHTAERLQRPRSNCHAPLARARHGRQHCRHERDSRLQAQYVTVRSFVQSVIGRPAPVIDAIR